MGNLMQSGSSSFNGDFDRPFGSGRKHKVSGEQWDEIRERYNAGESSLDLAVEFGISAGSIRNTVGGEKVQRISPETKKKVIALRKQGVAAASIAEQLHIHRATVYTIIQRDKKKREGRDIS